jgi:hypothetical protein
MHTDLKRRQLRNANELAVLNLPAFGRTYLFHCECGRPECEETFKVYDDEYLLARRRHGYIVAYDHVDRERERKISCCGNVCVVVPKRRPTHLSNVPRDALAA